jgi:Putative zinc-finger
MLAQTIAQLRCGMRMDRRLSAYLDHELSDADAAKVSQHLMGCSRCQKKLEQISILQRALGQFEIPVSRGQWTSVVAQPSRSLQFDSRLRRLCAQRISVPLPLAAGLVLVLCAGLVFSFAREERNRSAVTQLSPPQVETKIVEVPVERVVVRTVYRDPTDQKTERRSGKNVSPVGPRSNLAQKHRNSSEWSTRTMGTFRPASSANIRVVKEPEQ